MLRTKRVKKRLTQLELAEQIGVTESYISRMETHPESCNPNVTLILKISYALKTNPVKIFLYFVNSRPIS
jgi:transcriptional regulator with XRE-family HTH domain